MKSISSLITASLLVIFVTACGPKKQEDSVEIAKETNDAVLTDQDEEKDADFIVNTIAGNYAEIKLAKLAQSRSNDAGVKDLAEMLEKDHTQVVNDLKSYASKNNITVPIEESTDAKKDYNDLAEIQDVNKFDEKWCDALKDKHQASIDKFEKRLSRTDDAELKTWITATLPTLRMHLDMLKQNEDRLQ